MTKIALIDDKDYGISQIKDMHSGEEFDLEYFDTFSAFQESGKFFDIVYLDYYLSRDGITGADVIDEVRLQAKEIIGFSMTPTRSKKLKELGADDAVWKKFY
ncbi:hypothetical protein ACFL16_02945 [Patescibacteria group bacterium]